MLLLAGFGSQDGRHMCRPYSNAVLTMIELACHTWAFNDLTLPEALGTIARMGFRNVDIGSGPNFNAPRAAEDPKGMAASIRRDLDAFNLKLSDLYLMLPRISIIDADKRQKDIDLFTALIPFAAALGAPGITLSPGLAHPVEDEAAWERTVSGLREMVEKSEKAGLKVSIEPHMDSMAQTPDAALKLVKEIKGLQLTVDWAHMICQDVLHDKIVKLLPHARHIQMRQAARAQLQTPFERGRIEPKRVMAALKAANYEGAVSVEYMNTPGWHGALAVNTVKESAKMRDALRDARDNM